MMRTKQAQEEERAQYEELRSHLTSLKSNLTSKLDQQKQQEQPTKQSGAGRHQVISKDNTIYLDDFARHQQSPSRTGGFEEKRHVE